MPVINVVKPFILQLDPVQIGEAKDEKTGEVKPVFAQSGEQKFYDKGLHEVSDAIAGHWYVLAHCEGFVEPPPTPAAPDFMQKMLLAARAGRNTTSVEDAQPPPAPLPPGVVPAERHYFAGQKIEDQPAPPSPAWMKGP